MADAVLEPAAEAAGEFSAVFSGEETRAALGVEDSESPADALELVDALDLAEEALEEVLEPFS